MRFASLTLAVMSISLVPAGSEAVNLRKDILPLVEAKCIEFHQTLYEEAGRMKTPKAALRVDATSAINMGSNKGTVLIAGKAEPLTTKELALFKEWIEETYKRLAKGVEVFTEKSWESITEAGGIVTPLSKTRTLLLVDDRLTTENASDQAIASIRVIASNVVHLDLAKTSVSDDSLSMLSESPRLVGLNLSQTGITDAGFEHLAGLVELRYLNLYHTNVTDVGLKNLEGISSLETIYLWQSKATKSGVAKLRSSLPHAKIDSQ